MKPPLKLAILFGTSWVLWTNTLHAQVYPSWPNYLDSPTLTLEKETELHQETRNFGRKSLSSLIAELLAHNPQLKGLVEKIQAYEKRIPQASALEDPRLSFEASNLPLGDMSLDRTPMTGLQIYLRQKFPFPGKLRLKKKIAKSQWEQQQQAYYEQLNQLVAKFKQAYYRYVFIQDSILLNEQTHARLVALTKFLEARYAAGQATQQDVLKTKLEISSIEQKLIELKETQKIHESRINTLLYRPPELHLRLKKTRPKLTGLNVSMEKLRSLAQDHRPWLKKTEMEIEEADFAYRLAKKSLIPDFDLGVGYRIRDDSGMDPVHGEDFFSAGLSLNIPLYGVKKQGKHIQEMAHQKRMRAYLKEATAQEVRFQVESVYYDLQRLRAQIHLLNSKIIPQAHANIEASRASYEAGEVEFINVLLSEISLLKHRLQQVQFHSEYHQKLADLEMAVGVPIHVLNQNIWRQENDYVKK